MATAVGLRSVISRHWTGSLLELDSTRYQVNDNNQYFTDSDERNDQCWKGIPTDISQVAWASRSKAFGSLAELDPGNARSLDTISVDVARWSTTNSDSQHNGPNSIAPLSFEQLLGLSQLLKFIHGRSPSQTSGRHHNNNKDVDYKDSYSQRRTGTPSWKCVLSGQAMLNNHTSSLTNLPNSLSAHPTLSIDLHDPISLILNRPKRRHYNSESELFLPESNPCDVSNEAERPSSSDENEIPEKEEQKDKPLESDHFTSEQGENMDDSCLTTEDFLISTHINRTDNPGQTEPSESADLDCQSCTVTNESNQSDKNHQTNEPKECETGNSGSSDVPAESTKPTNTQTEQDCKCTGNDKNRSSSCILPTKASRTSLKISKSVSFADEIGQCLTETFIFDDNEDAINVPEYEDFFDDPVFEPCFKLKVLKSDNQNRFTRSRLKRAPSDPFMENEISQYKSSDQISPIPESVPNQTVNLEAQPMWNLTFPQPASQYSEFRHRLESNSVSLESITLTQPNENEDLENVKLSGTIKVKNISFEKRVWLRASIDNWQTHVDYPTAYSPELSTGTWSSPSRFDTFVFHVTLNLSKSQMSKDKKIEFAIRYTAGSNGELGEFWDSNNGRNYVIEMKMVRPLWAQTAQPIAQTSKTPQYTSTQHHELSPYTHDYRPNFDGFSSFTDYRAWRHFAGETSYY